MARSRKKSSQRSTSNAKATAATDSVDTSPEDPVEETPEDSGTTTDTSSATSKDKGAAKDSSAGRDEAAGKDPVKRSKGGKDPVAPKGGQVTEKAKDSTRSTSVKKAAAAESTRTTGRRVAAATQNPAWLAPTAVVLLILGLLYLVTYYISAGQLPLPIGDWNLAAGFGVLMVGGGMLMFWK